MMLLWATKQAQAYPVCGADPDDPAEYSSCMSTCGTTAGACDEFCEVETNCGAVCEGDPGSGVCGECEATLGACLTQCNYNFDTCATVCYDDYCI